MDERDVKEREREQQREREQSLDGGTRSLSQLISSG